MPEFDVSIWTVRSGSSTLRISAADEVEARNIAQTECDAGKCHCTPEWCTDDVASSVAYVRRVVAEDVTNLTTHPGSGASA